MGFGCLMGSTIYYSGASASASACLLLLFLVFVSFEFEFGFKGSAGNRWRRLQLSSSLASSGTADPLAGRRSIMETSTHLM